MTQELLEYVAGSGFDRFSAHYSKFKAAATSYSSRGVAAGYDPYLGNIVTDSDSNFGFDAGSNAIIINGASLSATTTEVLVTAEEAHNRT